MNIAKGLIGCALILGLGCVGFAPPGAWAADSDGTVPAVIAGGFKLWAAKDASYAVDVWKIGGLLENDSKPGKQSAYFNRMDRALGKFKSYQKLDPKVISDNSRIVYVAINFERAVVYARFLMYRTDKDWVVQDMDFSPKPEAIMPWLAFAGQDYSQ